MRLLVTGGAGFIGSHLAERLVEAGHEVLIYDGFTKLYAPALKRRNVAAPLAHSGCTLIEGDLLDEQRLDSVFSSRPFDVVFHLGAWCGAHVSLQHPFWFGRNNITGTLNVLERCRMHGVSRVVFTSSAAVYGARPRGLVREDDPTDRPISPYGVTKKAAEMWCSLYHHLHGTSVTILRLFSVYGPRQRPDQSMHQFARCAGSGEPIKLRGDGSSVRDPIYVDDAVAAMLRAMELPPGFEVVNVGSGQGRSVLELATAVAKAFGSECTPALGAPAAADQPCAVADVSRAARLLGWKPLIGLDEGLQRFANWFRAQEFADEA